MSDLKIVDPHHHLWDLAVNSYHLLQTKADPEFFCGDVTPIQHNYLAEDYFADTKHQNVVKSVFIEAGSADSLAEVRWVQHVADLHGFPHGIVAAAELNDPGVERLLATYRELPNLRGIRHIVNWHRDPKKTYVTKPDYLTDDGWLSGFAMLEKYGLSFDLQLYPSQMEDAARVAARYPSTQIVLNHAGMPVDRDEGALNLWRSGVRRLAGQPNVAVKISGLGMVDHRWTTESIRPFVLHAIDCFGVERCMFASNFPVDKLYSDYDTLFEAFKVITQDFHQEEREQLFGANAERIYRI